MANVEQELLRIAETLRVLEDEREIIRLISAYGPAVDSGQSEAAAALWTEDGVYDTDSAVWSGRAEIAGMVEGDFHQKLIAEGAAQCLGVPHIRISGHRAVATCYSRVFRHGEEASNWARRGEPLGDWSHSGRLAGGLSHEPPARRIEAARDCWRGPGMLSRLDNPVTWGRPRTMRPVGGAPGTS